MSYSHCLSDESLIKNATQCTTAHHNRLVYIAQYVQDELRIAAACCSLHLRHSCFSSTISKKCDRHATRFVMEQIEGPYHSLISSVCAPYFMSVKHCHNRIDSDVWQDMLEVSLPPTTSANQTALANKIDLSPSDREQPMVVEDGELLKAKLDELKFQESFLALIYIIKRD